MTDKTILNLDDLTEPMGQFRLDGALYDFRRWDALSLRERNRIGKISERLREIEAMEGDAADAAEAEYNALVTEGVGVCSTMTTEQIAGASQDKVREVLLAFLGQRQARQIEMLMTMAQMTSGAPSTGETPSPGFNRAGRRAAQRTG